MAKSKRPPPKKQQSKKSPGRGVNSSVAAKVKAHKAKKAAEAAELKAAQAAAEALREKRAKQRLTKQKRARQQAERDLKSTAGFLETIGLIKPGKLTPAKRRSVKRLGKEWGEFNNPEKYTPVKIPRRKADDMRKRAAVSGLKTTPTHIVVPREGYTKPKLSTSTTGRPVIKRKRSRRGQLVKGERVFGNVEEETMILFSAEETQQARDRLREEAAALGPINTKAGEWLAFKTHVNGRDGFSHDIYSSVEKIIDRIENYYGLRDSFKTEFFEGVTIVKTTPQWVDIHASRRSLIAKQRAKLRRQRRRAVKRSLRFI